MIWSCAAPSEPCMFGSATLAIVVSSTCMIVASMIETVISPLLATAGGAPRPRPAAALIRGSGAAGAAAAAEADRRQRGRPRTSAGRGRGRCRPRRWRSCRRAAPAASWPGVELHPERHPLHHLDPVAAGVLRRQERELRAGAGADRADLALERLVADRCRGAPRPAGPRLMWVRSVSLKFASIQLLSVATSASTATAGVTYCPCCSRSVWLTTPSRRRADLVCARSSSAACSAASASQHRRVRSVGDVRIAGQRRLGREHPALGLRQRAARPAAASARCRRRWPGWHDAGLQQRLLPIVLGLGGGERIARGRRLGRAWA